MSLTEIAMKRQPSAAPGARWLWVGVLTAALGTTALIGAVGDAAAAPRPDGSDRDAATVAAGPPRPAARGARATSAHPAPSMNRVNRALAGESAGPAGLHRSAALRRALSMPLATAAIGTDSVPTGLTAVFPPGPIRSAILAVQAVTYGYPLLEFERFRSEAPGLNIIWSETGFAAPDVVPIWRPNTDTLYSRAVLDLSGGPVVLSVPDMGDRYFSFQLNDPYTNAISYLGTRATGPGPGLYAITWDGGPQVAVEGAQSVTVPYRNIALLGRTLAGDEADQRQAIALMDQYSLTPSGPTGSPPPQTLMPSGLAMLDAISAAMELNPPPGSDTAILQAIAQIGVGSGLRVTDAGLGPLARIAVDLAARAGFAAASFRTASNQYLAALGNHGWAAPPSAIGNYGTDYKLRAGVFFVGPWANIRDEAIYLGGLLDQTLRPLNGHNSYQIYFAPGQEPPIDAFWSVTVYDSDGSLVANPINRYSVSSSRPDELVRRPDGSVVIVLSQDEPGDTTVNWLPVPDGSFSAYMRLYLPGEPALDGRWQPPPITRL
ncbi:MAG: DUF1254 domain-containing protein [Mycobacterium sp.]